MKLYRVLAIILAALVLGAAANHYLELGWFGVRSKLVLTVLLLLVSVFLAMVFRLDQSRKAGQDGS